MKFAQLLLALSCAVAFPSLAGEPSGAPATASVERPDDALDSVVLIDGALVRGVVISDDASALTIRLRSGEEQVVPRAQVRALNRWRPAPLPAPHREGGPLIVSEDGSAVLTEPGGLRTQLDPLAFYKLVGRDDLAEALARRTSTRQAMVLSGAALASLGGLVLVGDLVADLIYGVSHVCFTYADCTAPPPGTSSNPAWAPALFVGGLAAIGVGSGVALYGAVGFHPDAGGVEQRRTLADGYNARTTQADPPEATPDALVASSSPSPLATVRVIPVASGRERGLGLRISF